MPASSSTCSTNCAVLVGDQRREVLGRGLLAAALADVLGGHREVDAVGLAADVLVDPVSSISSRSGS